MSIWVVNTSPVVFLGNLGLLELLHHEGREVYIPRTVAAEIARKPRQPRRLYRLPVQPGYRCGMSQIKRR
jgi:predicted nucleic acid-binding protein